MLMLRCNLAVRREAGGLDRTEAKSAKSEEAHVSFANGAPGQLRLDICPTQAEQAE